VTWYECNLAKKWGLKLFFRLFLWSTRMNALYVGDWDIYMSICDVVVPYKPLDSFFLFCFTVGDLPKVDVCGSVHPSTIHKKNPTRCNSVSVYCAWQRLPTTCPTTFYVWKTRGCQCSFRLLMMGSVSLETCWASYKYGIIKFWYIVASCWIFLYELPKVVRKFKIWTILIHNNKP
jgi:hypothetical protein